MERTIVLAVRSFELHGAGTNSFGSFFAMEPLNQQSSLCQSFCLKTPQKARVPKDAPLI
jgi:hypothetical protein